MIGATGGTLTVGAFLVTAPLDCGIALGGGALRGSIDSSRSVGLDVCAVELGCPFAWLAALLRDCAVMAPFVDDSDVDLVLFKPE